MDASIAIPLAAVIIGLVGLIITLVTFSQNAAEIRRKANIDWVDGLQDRIGFLDKENIRLEKELKEVKQQLENETNLRQEEHKQCEEAKVALELKHQQDKRELMGHIDFMREQISQFVGMPVVKPPPEEKK